MFQWLHSIFDLPHFDAPSLVAVWFANAAASGKPRGLKWSSYLIVGEAILVPDRSRWLVPVQVQFEPLPDGGFDDIPQAREPRNIVVIFARLGRDWDAGQALFNVTVESLLKRFTP